MRSTLNISIRRNNSDVLSIFINISKDDGNYIFCAHAPDGRDKKTLLKCTVKCAVDA